MNMTTHVLSDEEKKIIHEDAIRILEDVGVKFPSELALETLKAGGAKIDYDNEIAYISQDMVKKALSITPKEVNFGGRNPDNDFKLPRGITGYNLDGCGVYVHDYDTGKRKDAVLKDVADSSRVFDELDMGLFIWPPISPEDVPYGPRSIISTATCIMNSGKHVQDEVKTRAEVPYIVEIAKAVAGSESEMRRRKTYSVTYCTVAPLSHDKDMMEATMDLIRYDLPVLIYPMPATGSTGPASLYSNLALSLAEELSSIVLFQLYSPGTPLVFGASLGSINVRNGLFLEGAPETTLMLLAMKDMADYYNMPNIIAGCLTEAKAPGIQAGIEKISSTLPLVMGGTDVVQGMGFLESSMILSLEQLIIDNEIAHICKRLKDGVDINPEKNYFDDIKTVGPCGHFLKQKSTRKAFRSEEFYEAPLLDRGSYDEWITLGSPDLLQKAHQRVETILAAEQKDPIDKNLEKIIKEVMEEAKAKLV